MQIGRLAILREEVVAMRNYITKALRVIILVIVLLVVFAIKAE